MTERLLKIGANPADLFEQFRERDETREATQEDVRQRAQLDLTADTMSVREYRQAREAEGRLLVESGIPLEDMTHSDYRKAREAQQRGERLQSYSEYQRQQEKNTERT